MTDLITEARAVIEAEACRPNEWQCTTHVGTMRDDTHCYRSAPEVFDIATRLLAVVEAVTALADEDYDHNPGCEGEPECPACWVCGLRAALTPKED